MFKKVLFTVLLFCPSVVWGQLLSVTATLTDPDSVVWVNGTCSVQLYSPNGVAFFGTTVVPTAPQACAINGSGVLSTSIYNTSTITPLGAQYRFSIGSATSAPASSFLTPVTAANMTSTLSAQLVAPRFSAAIAYAYGYADVEAVATSPGGQYYKTTSTAGQRIWSGSAWTSGGGGGGSGCTAIGAAGILQASNGSGVCQASIITDPGTGIVSQNFGGLIGYHLVGGADGDTFLGTIDSGGYSGISFNGVFNSGNAMLGIEGNNNGTDLALYLNAPTGGGFNFRINAVTKANVSATGISFNNLPVPSLDSATPTASQSVCVKVVGPPMTLGTCSSVVGAGGACTCN